MNRLIRGAALLGVLWLQAWPAAAQGTGMGQAPAKGITEEMVAQFDDAASKILQLAEAMPQEKYGWRPGAGVRSVSEVYMHVVGANYLLPTFFGVKSPVEMKPDMETAVTDKAQVLSALRESAEHVRKAIRGLSAADLDKPVTMFGQQTTYRGAVLLAVVHAHEHLGQSIAYARTNSVVPPWSAGR